MQDPNSSLRPGPALRGEPEGPRPPPIDMLGPPNYKLSIFKTAAFVLFQILAPPDKRLPLPPKSTALAPALSPTECSEINRISGDSVTERNCRIP